ncbi:TPA: DNA replication and repair protein RecF, partial [Klebsiella pneumoniae]
ELCLASDEIDGYRRSYIQALKPVFEQVLAELVELQGLTLSYYRGWDKEKPLAEVLLNGLHRDQQMGHTHAGPQRADLRLRMGTHNAAELLSRGQQKLVVCALRIAQGHLLNEARRGQCIYLVDDLPSELDEQHRRALCRLLDDLQCQVFITCVDQELMTEGWRTDTPVAVFHVEHGMISASGVN